MNKKSALALSAALDEMQRRDRNATIEECARVAERWVGLANPPSVAGAIRALKKP